MGKNLLFTTLLICILISPILTVSNPSFQNISETHAKQNIISTHQEQSSLYQKNRNLIDSNPLVQNPNLMKTSKGILPSNLKSVSMEKILNFDTFSNKQAAISKLLNSGIKIVYDFKNIPAISIQNSKKIPELKGLQKTLTSQFNSYALSSHNKYFENLDSLSTVLSGTLLDTSTSWIGLNYLWNKGFFGENQRMAIVDTGINNSLAAFKTLSNLSQSRVFDFAIPYLANSEGVFDHSTHGSHVGGIAVGNGIYNVNGKLKQYKSHGVAPFAQVDSIKVLNRYGFGESAWVLEGLDMAISKNVSVISMSFGSTNYNGTSDLYYKLVKAAQQKDILLVAAAGNDGVLGGSTIGIPAALPNVIGVGAAINQQQVWGLSSQGPSVPPSYLNKPDIIAPGVQIVSVGPHDVPSVKSGTSMGVPHVSAGALLLREAFPQATSSDIKQAILAGAKDLGVNVEVQGRGLVNFTKSYLILDKMFSTNQDPTEFANSNPIVIHDGTEYRNNGYDRVRKPNSWFVNNIIGSTSSFNISVFSARNLTVNPRVDYKYGNVSIQMPKLVKLNVGENIINVNITINDKRVIQNKAELYFIESSTAQKMKFMNITYFSTSTFERGKILFDVSKEGTANQPGYYYNNGPQGKFNEFGNLLRLNGFSVAVNHETITKSTLNGVNLLIIADPNYAYSPVEVEIIRKFVDIQGGSLLILANGGTFVNENQPVGPFAVQSVNQILNMNINNKNVPIRIITDNNNDGRIDYNFTKVPVNAQINKFQKIIPAQGSILSFGPQLDLLSKDVIKLATFGQSTLAAAANSGKGRVAVFSSVLPFTSQLLNYGSTQTDAIFYNRMASSLVNWLISDQVPIANMLLNGKLITGTNQLTVKMYEDIRFNLQGIQFSNKTQLNLPQSTQAFLIHKEAPYFITQFNITRTNNEFFHKFRFDFYGAYTLVIPILQNGKIVSSTQIDIFANLEYYTGQDQITNFSFLFLGFLILSWVLWVKNEGQYIQNKLLRYRKRFVE